MLELPEGGTATKKRKLNQSDIIAARLCSVGFVLHP